jgi:hypothetical protein
MRLFLLAFLFAATLLGVTACSNGGSSGFVPQGAPLHTMYWGPQAH